MLGLLAHSIVSGAGHRSRTEEGGRGFTAAPSRKPVPPDGAPASRGLAEEILAFLVALG